MKYKNELVVRLNEIYHDAVSQDYDRIHPEIVVDEVNLWQSIGKRLLHNFPQRICLLDIGSGTGFVPLQISRFLKKTDQVICSDISADLLSVCKKNVLQQKFNCDFRFIKLDGKLINLESDAVNFITMNSVLHHIPDFLVFFREIDRLLKAEGFLIIGHEPNKAFYTHRFLWNNYRFVSAYFDQEVGIHHKMVESVNERLLKEKIIETPLSAGQIIEIVDIHSPTAGGYHKDRGIDVTQILSRHLRDFKIELFKTYSHLYKISSKNRIIRWYDAVLKYIFPKKGALFLGVFKKIAS